MRSVKALLLNQMRVGSIVYPPFEPGAMGVMRYLPPIDVSRLTVSLGLSATARK
jgi:hypothetical protein